MSDHIHWTFKSGEYPMIFTECFKSFVVIKSSLQWSEKAFLSPNIFFQYYPMFTVYYPLVELVFLHMPRHTFPRMNPSSLSATWRTMKTSAAVTLSPPQPCPAVHPWCGHTQARAVRANAWLTVGEMGVVGGRGVGVGVQGVLVL